MGIFDNFDNNFNLGGFAQGPGLGLDPRLNRALGNLAGTLDPRDQLAHDLRQFQQYGVGNVRNFLGARLGQIDPRDQEAQDIRDLLRPRLW
ncbi:MAG: hypothetical protein EA420_16340 [Candidatus Competibacteraceae bacterium]|nr:MAG: hypothetical protein EA420_16340 [Candidatus Competibacteraceae bacterium]